MNSLVLLCVVILAIILKSVILQSASIQSVVMLKVVVPSQCLKKTFFSPNASFFSQPLRNSRENAKTQIDVDFKGQFTRQISRSDCNFELQRGLSSQCSQNDNTVRLQ